MIFSVGVVIMLLPRPAPSLQAGAVGDQLFRRARPFFRGSGGGCLVSTSPRDLEWPEEGVEAQLPGAYVPCAHCRNCCLRGDRLLVNRECAEWLLGWE